MEQVETILHNCEELIHYETELQAQINNNQKLICHHEQVINQITYHIGTLNTNSGSTYLGSITNQGTANLGLTEVLKTEIE
jgi:hypothetical protein